MKKELSKNENLVCNLCLKKLSAKDFKKEKCSRCGLPFPVKEQIEFLKKLRSRVDGMIKTLKVVK